MSIHGTGVFKALSPHYMYYFWSVSTFDALGLFAQCGNVEVVLWAAGFLVAGISVAWALTAAAPDRALSVPAGQRIGRVARAGECDAVCDRRRGAVRGHGAF